MPKIFRVLIVSCCLFVLFVCLFVYLFVCLFVFFLGTDSAIFGAITVGESVPKLVVVNLFREQNVVCKFVVIKTGLRGASKDAQVFFFFFLFFFF